MSDSVKKSIHLSDIYDVMVEMLEADGKVNFNPRGISMLPMLHNDGDRVIIEKAKTQLKKYDLPLYRRENGQFVLHRIVRMPKDNTLCMCGDNQWRLEKGVKHSQIIGVVTGFYRKNKFYAVDNSFYKFYCRVWVFLRPLRMIKPGIGKILRILKLKK